MPYIFKSNDSIIEIRESGALKIPTGTTSQRPSVSEAGYIRYNTSTGEIEYFDGVNWKSLMGATLSAGSALYVLKSGDMMTGSLGIVSGTTSVAGLYFTGNTNTGIYSERVNEFDITAGGNKKAAFSNTENIFYSSTGINAHSALSEFEIHSPVSDIFLLKRTSYFDQSYAKITSTFENEYVLTIKNANSALPTAQLTVDVKPPSNTDQAIVSFFKNTMAATATFEIFKGDGTPNKIFFIQENYGFIDLSSGGFFGIGTQVPSESFHVTVSALFDNVVDINDRLVIKSSSSPTDNVFLRIIDKGNGNTFITFETLTSADWFMGKTATDRFEIGKSAQSFVSFDKDITNVFTDFHFGKNVSYEYNVINFLQDTSVVSLPVTIVLSASAGLTSLMLGNDFKDGSVVVISNKSSQTIIVSANYPFDGVFSAFSLSPNTTVRFIFSSAQTTWFVL